jgi:putative aldouronate transport system permease protein
MISRLPTVRFGDVSYDAVKWLLVVSFTLVCVLPFVHVLGISLMTQKEALRGADRLWPVEGLTLQAYRTIFATRNIARGLINSVYITALGTAISMVLTTTFAYGLASRTLPGNRMLNFLVFIAIVFKGGIVPLYIVVKTLGLLNTYWSLVLPLAMNPFWVILMRNFFESLPSDLFESARLDGAPEMTVYARIVLPLSKAALAAISLFYAVFNWNAFFNALMFITDAGKWPIQVWLQQLISDQSMTGMSAEAGAFEDVMPVTMRMAVVVVATVPILLLYPFLQKHFAKGVMLGAVKG